jgi:hypothetical protein
MPPLYLPRHEIRGAIEAQSFRIHDQIVLREILPVAPIL